MGEAVCSLEMPPSPPLTDGKNRGGEPDRQTVGRGRKQGRICMFMLVLLMFDGNAAAFSNFR